MGQLCYGQCCQKISFPYLRQFRQIIFSVPWVLVARNVPGYPNLAHLPVRLACMDSEPAWFSFACLYNIRIIQGLGSQ